MIYRIILSLKVWMCTCEEKMGNDTMCPKHGFQAAMIRGLTIFVICVVVVTISALITSLGAG